MRTVTILLNQRCPLSCAHCSQGYSASNRGEKHALAPARLRAIIRGMRGSAYTVALLAGGEPSLNPELIALGVRECAGAGLVSAVITAPMWAATPESAGRFLDKVRGLNMLVLSYDSFHLEALTLAHYRNAAAAAKARGMQAGASITYRTEAERDRLKRSLAPLKDLLAEPTCTPVVTVGNAVSLPAAGRSKVRVRSGRDLDRLTPTCSAGKVSFVDSRLALYGCCWAVYGGQTPFDLPPAAGATLRARFARLEKMPALRRLRATGFVASLSPAGKNYAAAALGGRAFYTECELCMELMRGGHRRVWEFLKPAPEAA